MQRLQYFLRRLLLVIPTFLGITFVTFGLTQFVPGGPVDQALMQMRGVSSGEAGGGANSSGGISDEQRQALIRHYGFDQPIHVQYGRWLWTHRMGMTMQSYAYPNRTVWQLIRQRFPVSLTFGITGFILTYLICIPLGVSKALRNGETFDVVSSIAVFVGYAIPAFAFGMLLKMLFTGSVEQFWNIFPAAGFHSDHFASLSVIGKAKDLFAHMFLPVLCYVIGSFAVLTLLMKNSLLEQIGKDYIRTVIAKGGSSRRAIWGHALRNSMIPIATGFGSVMTLMFAGSVIIEQVFEIPGMGRLSLSSIVGRDYPVFMGILAITALLGMLGNILSDFCYILIDPRINFDR